MVLAIHHQHYHQEYNLNQHHYHYHQNLISNALLVKLITVMVILTVVIVRVWNWQTTRRPGVVTLQTSPRPSLVLAWSTT